MIETLALRDRMTARHSAAVARYARAMAARAAAGRPRTSDLVHTAGLLHDIGKFAFPDSILLADSTADRRAAARSSSAIPRTARASSAGSTATAPVAEVILSHHERWDGNGYPRGLAGEDDPARARG